MENVLKLMSIDATPDSLETLYDYLNKHHGPDKLIAWTCAMMAWNLAVKLNAPGDES